MTTMKQYESNLVQPGGRTGCVDPSSPFIFQVIPRATDKLMISFQGGGGCWDKNSTTPRPLCTTTASAQSLVGIYANPPHESGYENYTVVELLYCSGDLHAGDVHRNYSLTEGGKNVIQSGYYNTMATIEWIRHQMDDGSLSKSLTSLVIIGQSAGSVAAQLWSDYLLKTFKYKSAIVIPDSFVAVAPAGFGKFVKDYGICKHPDELLQSDEYLIDLCNNGQLDHMSDVVMKTIKKHPNVTFAFIQAKEDRVQWSYYNIQVKSIGNVIYIFILFCPFND